MRGDDAGDGKAAPGLLKPADRRMVRALGHVLRQRILLAAVQGEVGREGLSSALGQDPRQIGYHLKVLREDCDGLIERTRTERRPGRVEHYYRASVRTPFSAEAGEESGPAGADG